jgi:hypothetical protein
VRAAVCALFLAFTAGTASADEATGGAVPPAKAGIGVDWSVKDGGGLLTAKGSDTYFYESWTVGKVPEPDPEHPLNVFDVNTLSFFVGATADARWATSAAVTSYGSLRVTPTFALGRFPTESSPRAWKGYFFVEGRQIYGDVAQESGTTLRNVDQRLYGAGLGVEVASVNSAVDPPRLSVSWYHVDSNEGAASLPTGITDNQLEARLLAELQRKFTLGASERVVSLAVDASARRATAGTDRKTEHLVDLQLRYLASADAKYKTVLRYRDGSEHGLEYDREILLGVLLQLLD